MNSNTKGFIFIVVLVVIIIGGLVVANNRQKNTDSASATTNSATSDPNKAPVTASFNPDNKDQVYIDDLAKFMTVQGMTLYGAAWCPHCKAQREAFGSAVNELKYIECSADQTKPQAEVCNNVSYTDTSSGKETKGIQGYPTWIYQGKGYPGEKTITELAQIVGFSGTGTTTPVQ